MIGRTPDKTCVYDGTRRTLLIRQVSVNTTSQNGKRSRPTEALDLTPWEFVPLKGLTHIRRVREFIGFLVKYLGGSSGVKR